MGKKTNTLGMDSLKNRAGQGQMPLKFFFYKFWLWATGPVPFEWSRCCDLNGTKIIFLTFASGKIEKRCQKVRENRPFSGTAYVFIT